MIDWLILGVYLVGFVVTARRSAPWFLDNFACDVWDPDTGEIWASRAIAFCGAFFWPMVLVGVAIFWNAPRSQYQVEGDLRKREEEVQDRERYIDDMERKLGIGKYAE